MSVSNILNNDPLGKQIDQPNLTIDNTLTVKDVNVSGVMNVTTLAVDNLSLYTQQAPYTGDSATLNYQNADFSLGKITGLDTSVPPNGTYYSKLQFKPQIDDATPELFFVGRDANADNSTRQIGAFVRSRNVTGAGAFTSEARLGLTNVEPDGVPAVPLGQTYAFRLPVSGSTDALTLSAFDTTGVDSQKDILNVLPSGARPYQTYQTTVAGNVVKLMSDQTAGVIVANSANPNVFGTVYDSNITQPVQFMPRTGFPNQYIVSGVVASTLGSQGFEFTVPATGMYMLTTSFISAFNDPPYTNTTNPIAGDCIEVIWEQAGTSLDTITGSTFIYCSELPPVPTANTYYGKTYTTVAFCQQGQVNQIGAYIFNLGAGVTPVGSYNIRMVLTRMCGLGGYTVPA